MDNKLLKVKEDLLKGEMQNLVFTEEMKRKVLAEIKSPSMSRQNRKTKSRAVPAALSLAAMTAFAIGMYYIVSSGLVEEPNAEKPPEETEITTPIEDDEIKENDTETEEETEEKLPEDTVEEEEEVEKPDNKPEQEHNETEKEKTDTEKEQVDTEKEQTDTEREQENTDNKKQEEPVAVEPTKEELAGIINEFMQTADNLNDTINYDINYKYPGLKTKEEFYRHFYHLADKQLVKYYFEDRLEEHKDGLYIVPMGGTVYSAFLDSDPYEIKKISTNEYQIIQEHSSEYFGQDILMYVFTKQNGQWKLTEFK